MSARREFQRLVDLRGACLRTLSYDDLVSLDDPCESVTISGRNGAINTIIEPVDDGRVRVVVQGFLDSRWLPSVKAVSLDGFYNNRAGTLFPMQPKEFYAYD